MKILLFLLLLSNLNYSYAHPGRTDASGCHEDKKNGGYHCHNSKKASSEPTDFRTQYESKSPSKNSKLYKCTTEDGIISVSDKPCE